MKKLSYMTISNIFLLLSLAIALSRIWVEFLFQESLWGLTLAVAYYYWGKDKGVREGRYEAERAHMATYKLW